MLWLACGLGNVKKGASCDDDDCGLRQVIRVWSVAMTLFVEWGMYGQACTAVALNMRCTQGPKKVGWEPVRDSMTATRLAFAEGQVRCLAGRL